MIDCGVRTGCRKAALLRIDVDRRINGNDLGNRRKFVFLVEFLVLRFLLSPVLVCVVCIEHMGVVVDPTAAADGYHNRYRQQESVCRQRLPCQLQASAQAGICTAARQQAGQHPEQNGPGQPVKSRPKERPNEVAVAIHVRVGVGDHIAVHKKMIRAPQALQNQLQSEDAHNDSMPDELVGNNGLHEEGEQSENQHIRESDDVEFLDVLQQLDVVITGDSLRQNSAEKCDREQE